MELLHRYSGFKQWTIGERFGGLDEGSAGRDRRAIREKIETEPKIRKWFSESHQAESFSSDLKPSHSFRPETI
jgi:hypothetical protein